MSFSLLATVSCSTKRAPDLSGGKRGTPATNLSGLSCTPLDPVDPELRARLELDTPHTLLETFLEGTNDIETGDVLVVSSVEYPIRAVEDWTWRDTRYQRLILENLRD